MGKLLNRMIDRVEQAKRAIERLRAAGAKEIRENGVNKLYVPGGYRLNEPIPVDTYGQYYANRKRTFKHNRRNGK